MNRFKLIVTALAFSIATLCTTAQDKPADPPTLTDAQKVDILKAQRALQNDQLRMADLQQQYQQLIQTQKTDSDAFNKLIHDDNAKAGTGWALDPVALTFNRTTTAPSADANKPAPVKK